MNSWSLQKLGDVADSCLGKMLDKEKNRGEFHPYLANYNVRWGGFDISNVQEMRFEDHEHERYGLVYGDLVICEGGEPGRCAVWREHESNTKIQKALHRLRVKKGFDHDFIYYRMLQANRTGELARHFIGSTIKHLTGVSLKQVEFNFPCESIQRSIASTLRVLDKKIELNSRINAELEAMAKTLYDYWFVQFDYPDANDKPYKTSGGKMVYSETLKREIPAKWKPGTLDDLGQIVGGSTPPTSNADNFLTEGTPWISPNDLSKQSGCKFISRGATGVSDAGIKAASLKKYPAGTVLLSSRAPVGYMAIARNELTTNQGFKSFIPNNGYSSSFIYYAVSNSLKAIIQYSTGSTFNEISGSVLKTVKLCLPETEIVDSYTERTKAIFEQQDCLELENLKLAELRDWLLPMLMNGQVTVK